MVYLWEKDRSLYVDIATDLFHTLCDIPTPPPSHSKSSSSPRFLACEAVAHLRSLGIRTVIEACALGQRLIDDSLITPALKAPIPNGFADAHHVYRFTVTYGYEIAKSIPLQLTLNEQQRNRSQQSLYNFSEASFNEEEEPLALRPARDNLPEQENRLLECELFPDDASKPNWGEESLPLPSSQINKVYKHTPTTTSITTYDTVPDNHSTEISMISGTTTSATPMPTFAVAFPPRQETWHATNSSRRQYANNNNNNNDRHRNVRGLPRQKSLRNSFRRVRVRSGGWDSQAPDSGSVPPASSGIGPLDAPFTTDGAYVNRRDRRPMRETDAAKDRGLKGVRDLREPRRFRMPSLRKLFGRGGEAQKVK